MKLKKFVHTLISRVNDYTFNRKRLLKPSIFIIGGMKSGTTTLYQYLSNHPEVYTTEIKEPCYFSYNYSKGLKWYLTQYPLKKDTSKKIAIDASPVYLHDSLRSASRIHEFDRNAKIIVLMRDPIERAISHFAFYSNPNSSFGEKHAGTSMMEERTVDNAFSENIGGVEKRTFHNYCQCSLYYKQLLPFMDRFSIANFLFIDSSSFKENTVVELDRICKFLNVDSSVYNKFKSSSQSVKSSESFEKQDFDELKVFNVNSNKVEISKITRMKMQNYFNEDVNKLTSLKVIDAEWMKKYKA